MKAFMTQILVNGFCILLALVVAVVYVGVFFWVLLFIAHYGELWTPARWALGIAWATLWLGFGKTIADVAEKQGKP